MGVQRIFLRDGFIPLGLFPDAHKLKNYETLTLFAKFQPRRARAPEAGGSRCPQQLGADPQDPRGQLRHRHRARCCSRRASASLKPRRATPLEFEFIGDAPEYVRRKFHGRT